MAQSSTLFPTIGDIASQTNEITNEPETRAQFDNEDKVVQEIESLCMKCGEQVGVIFPYKTMKLNAETLVGYY
jgi:zinc finger protein